MDRNEQIFQDDLGVQTRQGQQGEELVVIAIIAVLIGLLLPA